MMKSPDRLPREDGPNTVHQKQGFAMRVAKRSIDRTHIIVLGLMIAALLVFIFFARPRILGQGEPPSPERQSMQQPTPTPDSK